MSTPTITKADFLLGGDLKGTTIRDADVDESPELDVMAGPCRLTHIRAGNVDSAADAAMYLKLYDDLNPTVGTSVPDYVFEIPLNKIVDIPLGAGIVFVNGLSFACVTVGGTVGTTGPVATKLITANFTLLPGVS